MFHLLFHAFVSWKKIRSNVFRVPSCPVGAVQRLLRNGVRLRWQTRAERKGTRRMRERTELRQTRFWSKLNFTIPDTGLWSRGRGTFPPKYPGVHFQVTCLALKQLGCRQQQWEWQNDRAASSTRCSLLANSETWANRFQAEGVGKFTSPPCC